ncbi:MAG: hypothetical protein ACREA0_22500 [bacterium]
MSPDTPSAKAESAAQAEGLDLAKVLERLMLPADDDAGALMDVYESYERSYRAAMRAGAVVPGVSSSSTC